ncbi:MAG: HAD family hydrolase [Muribaculaceae bacterium]|nr:HAD family hydrolase [Muribaculaceae bacterium]
MTQIRNIIFDFDGTLADTSKLIVATMQKTIKGMGLPFRNEDQIRATIGIRLDEIPNKLWPSLKGISKSFVEDYKKNFEELKDYISIEPFPEVKETLKKFKDEGYQMAVATSRSQRSVKELIEKLGIKDYFSYLLGGDDVSKGKPEPESIYKILSDQDWNYNETIMVGDMSVDILMGKKAGIRTCGVTYGNGKESELKETGADFVIADFRDLIKILKDNLKK